MGLLNGFKRYFHDVDISKLTTTTGSWGTTEQEIYLKDRTIRAYIQPLSGSEVLKNSSLDMATTHRMYLAANEIINDTDHIIYGGKEYNISYNPPEGSVSNIGDHKELLLRLQR